jgi:dipeptidyl aminopeptidase/acylaminoacyl peptidase
MTRSLQAWGVVCALLGSASVAAFAAPTAPAPDGAVHQYTIQQFLATVNWSGGSFSPDGKTLLASNDSSGVINLFSVPTAGGEARQLTRSTVSANRGLGYFPDGQRVLYGADNGGNEQTHLFVLSPDGTSRDLTPGDKVKAEFLGWSHDDKSFFFGTTERDPHYFDVYEMPVDLSSRKMLFKNEAGYSPEEVSADRRLIALSKPGESTEDGDVSVYDVATGKITLLTPHKGDIANNIIGFTTDSKWLYATTTEGSEFGYLQRFDLATGKATLVLKPSWDVVGGSFSRNGQYLAISINADARTETHLYALPAMTEVALPSLPDADVTGIVFSHDSRQMAFYGESSREPRNLFVLALGGAGTAPHQITHSLNPAIDPHDLVTAERIRFASYDGLQIPGILYRPKGATAAHLAPVMVNVHGGPGGQSRIGYSASAQYLVNHGYAIFSINTAAAAAMARPSRVSTIASMAKSTSTTASRARRCSRTPAGSTRNGSASWAGAMAATWFSRR